MAIWNLGSINIDHVYRVRHLPQPGETLTADSHSMGQGGKGANQAVAAARAGANVTHLGAVGRDGLWTLERLAAAGVETGRVAVLDLPTGHANIYVDDAAENVIVILRGANWGFAIDAVAAALAEAGPGDTLLLQNETAHQVAAARLARARGMRVVYSAAPFELAAVEAILPFVTTLALNAGEAAELTRALGCPLETVPVPELLITRGAEGAELIDTATGARLAQPAFRVVPVDTTGAGDCFAGSFAATRDLGAAPAEALRFAAAAAAIQVTRPGAGDAMPARDEVLAFLAEQAGSGATDR
ncbi:PfkB family carbohydrate kinase [Frigidibacter sp. MR17.14]|uniref:PfkB family carbohydrate kinase n=1 Tax=Frigidibacter sp. MR17.14 TaxID=3126509 RepID=UPI003012AF5F